MDRIETRKLFSLGEWITLLGAILVVISAALIWKRDVPPVTTQIGAIYVSKLGGLKSGYDLKLGWLPVGWTAVVCSVLCGALLLLEPSGREKRIFYVLHIALSIMVIALAALNIGPYMGSLMALIGGLLLLGGAVTRYH